MTYGKHFSAANTPQSQPLPGREAEMVKNDAGGYVFKISDMERVRRFLILGAEGGTYYASEAKLTRENAETVHTALIDNGKAVIDLAVDVSDEGLAPKNDPAIFVLALASVSAIAQVRKLAYEALPKICRIPTHLFTFVQYRQDLGGGWGRGMRAAVSKWYTEQTPAQLAVNALKYPSRNGWSHRDVFRLAHPIPKDEAQKAVFDAICEPEAGKERASWKKGDEIRGSTSRQKVSTGWEALRSIPAVDGWLALRNLNAIENVNPEHPAKVIREKRLQREMVPTELLTKPQIWDALLPNLGYTALLRNLGNLSKSGLLVAHSEAAKLVREKLANGEAIRKARVHPFAVLLAMGVYGSGASVKGSGVWKPVATVVDALDGAFELAFGNVEPTGKRYILGLDVSGSMACKIQGTALSSQQCAAAFAMVTARTEKEYEILGFDNGLRDLRITAKDSLQAVLQKTAINNGGGTDCALPIQFLRKQKIKADAVLVYTDGETWAGPVHAATELQAYRREMNVPLKLGMVAFEASGGSIGDPKDPGTMGFVGLDASLPQAINAFVSG